MEENKLTSLGGAVEQISPLILNPGKPQNEESSPRAKREGALIAARVAAHAYQDWLIKHPRPLAPEGWSTWDRESEKAMRACGLKKAPLPSRCEACRDRGWVIAESGAIVPCPDCSHYDREHCMKRAAKLPETRWGDTFESFNLNLAPLMRDAYQAAIDLCEATSVPWLVLAGQVGCGKTHLAYAAANRLIAQEIASQGSSVNFWVVAELLETMRGVFSAHDADATINPQQEFDRMTYDPRTLILDDFGAEIPTDWVGESLFRIIDRRYREGRGLLVTTNVSIADMPQRIASRFQDKSICRVVACASPDFRPQARAKKKTPQSQFGGL